jgi:periplasmic mercuric ion binding protein
MKKIMLISAGAITIYLAAQVCGCGSCDAKTVNTEFVKGNDKTVKLKITGMTCAGCSSHVTQTLEGVKGVSKVDLEYPGDVATIEYDSKATNKEELIAAIEKINYKAEEVKDKK